MAQYAYVVARNTRAGIQLEIDKAHDEGGGLVFLPRGVYALDGPLRLTSNVQLTGVGTETVLTVDPATGAAGADLNLIELDGGDAALPHDIAVSKLVLRGPGASPDMAEAAASGIGKGCGIVVAQREVRGIAVRACRIENVGGCGILFYTQKPGHLMADITIRDCHFVQNRRPDAPDLASNYKDIYFYGARFENVSVEGNVCAFTPNAESRYGNDSGIAFVGNGHGGYARHIRLVGNVCSGHQRHGIVTNYGTMEADGVFVADNRCENNGWAGIYVNTDFTFTRRGRAVITGNFCAHNGCGGLAEPGQSNASIRGGIVLNGAYHTVVTGNICTDNGAPDAVFEAHGRVADADAEHAAGIRVRGSEHIVDANLVKGNRGEGIVLWPGEVSRLSITNNRAIQNGKNGILIAGAAGEAARHVVVTGNVCTDNGENGIRSYLADGALVASNFISDNTRDGIVRAECPAGRDRRELYRRAAGAARRERQVEGDAVTRPATSFA
jgi:hypothetical protein